VSIVSTTNSSKSFASEEVGSVGLEDGSEFLFARSGDGFNDGESDSRISPLEGLGSSDLILFSDDGGSDDVDGLSVGSVHTGHFSIKLGDGSVEGHISVLLIHVMDGGSALVLQHDSVSSDGTSVLLEDLVNGDDFTISSLKLILSLHGVPESTLGGNAVGSENSGLDDQTFLFLTLGESPSGHEVLSDLLLEGGVSGILR